MSLIDTHGQELPCSGVITFHIQIGGQQTSVTAWVTTSLRNKLIICTGTLEDLDFSTVNDITELVSSNGAPLEDTRMVGIPGMGAATTRSTKAKEEPLSLDRISPGGTTMDYRRPFEYGWFREVVAKKRMPGYMIYYISPEVHITQVTVGLQEQKIF